MMKKDGFTTGYGPHLVLDGYDCDSGKISCLDRIFNFLDRMPSLIDMTKIMPPYVFRYKGIVPEDWGISGFVLIAESHISVHTYPDKRYLVLDAFSCKDFDSGVAIAEAVSTFSIGRYDHKVLDRGLEFPKNVQTVTDYMVLERGRCGRGNFEKT